MVTRISSKFPRTLPACPFERRPRIGGESVRLGRFGSASEEEISCDLHIDQQQKMDGWEF